MDTSLPAPGCQLLRPMPRYRLLRYFSVASAVATLILGAIAVAGYILHQTDDLLTTGEEQNISFATIMANIIWSEHGDYLSASGALSREQLLARPETAAISAAVADAARNLPLLKVKIFHPNGNTLFSSDFSQIGEDKSLNQGFQQASKDGRAASKTSFRGTFSAFSDDRANVHLVETYVPIKTPDGKTGAVFELYTDISPRVDAMEREIWLAALLSGVSCSIFYVALLLIVARADSAISSQDSALRASHAALETVKMRLDSALQNLSHGVSLFDSAGGLTLWNDNFVHLYRIGHSALRVGMSMDELRAQVGSANLSGPEAVPTCVSPFISSPSDTPDRDVIVQLDDGRYVELTIRSVPDGGSIWLHEDITGRRTAEQRIRHLALHDELTGLTNRASFRAELEHHVNASTHGVEFGVLLVDLDGFKSVNDTLGHATGDGLIKDVARRLKECVRKSDVVSRLGGDEFALIVPAVEGQGDANDIAQRILASLATPFEISGHTVSIGASIGIALSPEDSVVADILLKKADAALYRAKAEGRGTIRFFCDGMGEAIAARRALEVELREAIDRQQFELHYQPIVRMGDEKITAFEALLRWRHPKRGLVSPAEFIPIADETGLIKRIGAWALKQACADAAAWPEDISVTVNLSAVQFEDGDLLKVVDQALATSALAPQRLCLELTESTIIRNVELANEQLTGLKQRHIAVAMDDFGNGYSSLSHLRSIAFDKIKIDRAFVSSIGSSERSQSIVRAIVQLSEALGLSITAEGVETAEERQCLIDAGCCEAQGYYFGRPMPLEAILHRLNGTEHRQQAAA